MVKKRKKFNFIKLFVVLAIIAILAFGSYDVITKLILRSSQNISDDAKSLLEVQAQIPKDSVANIVAIGDTLCHSQNFKDAYDSSTRNL